MSSAAPRIAGAEPDALAPEKDELLGRTIGKYTLSRLLGVGGMGRVYEGVHASLGKRFALKFIDKESATAEGVQRFQREAQAASAVESAHIVDIFDVGTSDDGQHFIVMELLRGEDLGHRIRREGRLEVVESLRIIAHVLRGLARAHDAGIVHRDLKPDNVFLVERDDDACFAKILDFGVSKIQRSDTSTKTITRQGVVVGTPVYMSPEQAQALPDLDSRTDLWAVGAILYECLTGNPPFSGATYEAVIVGICTRDAEDVRMHNPEVPEGIAGVIRTALSRDKEQRYATARDMLDALVAESEGALPSSLKSDSLKRAVVRPPSGNGPHARSPRGNMSLAAVSTVAATPAVSGSSATQLQEAASKRSYVAIGAAAIAIGGVIAGVWYGRRSDATAPVGSTNSPTFIVVTSSAQAPDRLVNALGAAPVTVEPTAVPTATASATETASASASAPRPRGPLVGPRRGEPKVPPGGVGSDLGKIRTQ